MSIGNIYFNIKSVNKHMNKIFVVIRNPGREYGGTLNITYLGYYDTVKNEIRFDQSPPQTTIARRMNVAGISIRCMIVVSCLLENATYLTFEFSFLSHVFSPKYS